jgi:dienelactone hydrolase
MQFRGKFSGAKLEGTFEMLHNGKGAYKGLWSVKRVGEIPAIPKLNTRVAPAGGSRPGQQPSQQNRAGLVAELPSPSGPLPVGRTTFFWKDSTRPETMTDDPDDFRELMVSLWYPAQREGNMTPAVYFPHFELLRPSSSAALPRSLNAHAFEKASHVRQRFPVLLFSHGLGENTACYSSILEELASYGYVVAAIDHTYDNQGTVFPDGRILRQSDRWGRAFSGSQRDQERFIIERLNVLATDVSFVLNQLEELNDQKAGTFNGKLDMSQAGFFGHSLGGAIAPLVCQKDRRFKACLNMDGMPTSHVLILDPALRLERPFMFLTEKPWPTELELERRTLTRPEYEERDRARRRRMYHLLDTLNTESYVVLISGADHSSFSDNPLLASNPLSSSERNQRLLQIIRDYTRAFFDRYFVSNGDSLLDSSLTGPPEVTVERFGARVGP